MVWIKMKPLAQRLTRVWMTLLERDPPSATSRVCVCVCGDSSRVRYGPDTERGEARGRGGRRRERVREKKSNFTPFCSEERNVDGKKRVFFLIRNESTVACLFFFLWAVRNPACLISKAAANKTMLSTRTRQAQSIFWPNMSQGNTLHK